MTPKHKPKKKKTQVESIDLTGQNLMQKFSPIVVEDNYMDNNIKDFNVNEMDQIEPNDQQYKSPDKHNEQ